MRTHKMEIFIYYQNNELKFVYGYVFYILFLNGKSYMFIYCMCLAMFAYIEMQLEAAKIFLKI